MANPQVSRTGSSADHGSLALLSTTEGEDKPAKYPALFAAAPVVVLTMLAVGGLLALFVPLALPTAFLFGALISATDPVAVVALVCTIGSGLQYVYRGSRLLSD